MTRPHEVVERERSFHDERYSGAGARDTATSKYYAVSEGAWSWFEERVAGECAGKKVLELGCGAGTGPLVWLEKGAEVTCIDISAAGIAAMERLLAEKGHRADFRLMNAERTDFPAGSFDFVVGVGILHHLRLDRAYPEIARLLAPRGKGVFFEPLGHNPVINLYRRLTPGLRTLDEHPLKNGDIRLARQYFDSVTVRYFCLVSLLAYPFRNRKSFRIILSLFDKIDGLLFRIPLLRRYSWIAVLEFEGPRRRGGASG